jgi:hypothetical protein
MVVLSRGFPRLFNGRQVFTCHDGRLLSHWFSFPNIAPNTMWIDLRGVGGVSTSCQASIGMVVLQFGDFGTDSSRQIHPSDGRLSFLPNLLPLVLTHIHYKKVQSISQRSPVQWKVETRWVVASRGFLHLFKDGRYSLTTMVDCCLIEYPSTNIAPNTM